MRAMGASIERRSDGEWRIHGVGVGGLLQPREALDMGNSGTSTRLLMGLLASHPITATFIGDASLSGRPMGRVIDPLAQMGAVPWLMFLCALGLLVSLLALLARASARGNIHDGRSLAAH